VAASGQATSPPCARPQRSLQGGRLARSSLGAMPPGPSAAVPIAAAAALSAPATAGEGVCAGIEAGRGVAAHVLQQIQELARKGSSPRSSFGDAPPPRPLPDPVCSPAMGPFTPTASAAAAGGGARRDSSSSSSSSASSCAAPQASHAARYSIPHLVTQQQDLPRLPSSPTVAKAAAMCVLQTPTSPRSTPFKSSSPFTSTLIHSSTSNTPEGERVQVQGGEWEALLAIAPPGSSAHLPGLPVTWACLNHLPVPPYTCS